MSPPQVTQTIPSTSWQLLYETDDGIARALPQWAQTCFLIGDTIVRWEDNRARIVAGVALPTRAYAALMIAAGIVLEREKIKTIDTEVNFQRVMKLPVGTALLYNLNGKPLQAVFDGTQVVHGQLRLRVRVQKRSAGGGAYLLDATQALALEALVGVDGESALSHRAHRAKNSQELFLKNLLSHIERDEFLLYPRLDCLIIGTIVALRNEVHLPLASSGCNGLRPGTFQDILKIRRFVSQGHTYRSEVMAVGAEALPDITAPYTTLFDGALSFLKWREAWRQTHWIVVLDRTEPHFAEAVNILNQEYVSDRIEAELPILPGLPGIDIPSDGGSFSRLCSKMATGSGKTVVMAMLIAWQVINKVTYPQDARFSKYVFVVAPGLTVKSRLQVLLPAGKGNFYDEFNVVPASRLRGVRDI